MDKRTADLVVALGISHETIRTRGLVACPEAKELELVGIDEDGWEFLLQPDAATAFRDLRQRSIEDGSEVVLKSAFRSIRRQIEIIKEKLDDGETIEEVLRICAPPGYSEHHTGCAVDLSIPGATDLGEDFEFTSAFSWLQNNAALFGFTMSYPRDNHFGYLYEPWHWCYRQSE